MTGITTDKTTFVLNLTETSYISRWISQNAIARSIKNISESCQNSLFIGHVIRLMFVWPSIIDINNVADQLDAKITIYL